MSIAVVGVAVKVSEEKKVPVSISVQYLSQYKETEESLIIVVGNYLTQHF